MTARKLVEHQVRRVRRRLLLCKILESLMGFWAAGLVTCAIWLLVRPFVAAGSADWARFGIPVGVMVGATLAALLWSFFRAPRLLTASMALDEKFGLEERITTLTFLVPDQLNSPVGQALQEDARERVANLDVP